jgi:hypothetical protein
VLPKDVGVVARLHSIELKDLLAKDPQYRKLITTKANSDGDQDDSDNDLFWASYRMIDQDHPEYQQLDQRIEFAINRLRVVINREPIVALMGLIDTGVSADEELYVRQTTSERARG